jgi:hypothetical protein
MLILRFVAFTTLAFTVTLLAGGQAPNTPCGPTSETTAKSLCNGDPLTFCKNFVNDWGIISCDAFRAQTAVGTDFFTCTPAPLGVNSICVNSTVNGVDVTAMCSTYRNCILIRPAGGIPFCGPTGPPVVANAKVKTSLACALTPITNIPILGLD